MPASAASQPTAALAEWQAQLETRSAFVRAFAYDYPNWLKQTFDDQVAIAVYHQRGLGVVLDGEWVITCWLNPERGVYVWVPRSDSDAIAVLASHFSPHNLKPKTVNQQHGYRFMIYNQDDYDVLRDLTTMLITKLPKHDRTSMISAVSFTPPIFATADASFWRIHFPRELWDEARANDVIGIDWPPDATNQSMQRLKRIKVGDRVVVYLRGAQIGGIGVVTRPFSAIDHLPMCSSYPRREREGI